MISIGICVASPPDANFDNMYRSADQALYKAKAAGKNVALLIQREDAQIFIPLRLP